MPHTKALHADETIVTRIHRETRESLDAADAQLDAVASKATDLRRLLRTRRTDSAEKLHAVLVKR